MFDSSSSANNRGAQCQATSQTQTEQRSETGESGGVGFVNGPGAIGDRLAVSSASGSCTCQYYRLEEAALGGYYREFLLARRSTTGWEPSCTHEDKTGTSTVLDPFAGAGTSGLVATRLGRSFIGIELNPEYAEMARDRIRDDAPLMNYLIEAS